MLKLSLLKQSILSSLVMVFAFATHARSSSSDSSNSTMMQYFGATLMNPGNSYQQQIFLELLGTGGTTLNFPAFPRTWVQKERENYQETNVGAKVGVKLSLGLGDAGYQAKFNIGYKYKRKSSFVAITTTDASLGGLGNNNITTGQAPDPVLQRIRHFDKKTQRSFFVTDQQHPIVGFCIYELQLEMSKSGEGTISLLFGEHQEGQGEVRRETQAIYSKFFQVEGVDPRTLDTTGVTPESDYLTVKCEQQFNDIVSAYAEYEFNKIIIEYVGLNNPYNTCQVDSDCDTWYNRTQGLPEFASTVAMGGMNINANPLIGGKRVARCMQKATGQKFCMALSKENQPCPLYWDRNGQLTETFQRYKNATNQPGESRCDHGLKCVMDGHADGLLGFLFPNWGSAFCRRP